MPKKLFVIFCAMFLVACVSIFNVFNLPQKLATPYEVYIYDNSSTAEILSAQNCNIQAYFNVSGKSFVLSENTSPQQMLKILNAEVLFTQTTSYGTSIYAYSKDIKFRKSLNGKVINVHIFVGSERCVLGVPLIYGSY